MIDTEDAAIIGESLMEAIEDCRSHPLLEHWAPLNNPAEIVADLLNAYDEALTTANEARLRAESERDALLEVMRAVFPGWYEDYINNRPSSLTAPATDEDVERVAKSLCKTWPKTPNGCAMLCMDRLGSIPASGCHHAKHVHGERARTAIEALRGKP